MTRLPLAALLLLAGCGNQRLSLGNDCTATSCSDGGATAAVCTDAPSAWGRPTTYACAHATYYVSPSGSDVNSGSTDAAPLQHIQTALDLPALGAGDCVIALSGTYAESLTIARGGTSTDADGYVVLKSQTPGGAVIQSSGSSYALAVGASYVIVDGLDVTNPAGDYGISVQGVHHVEILNNTIHDCGGGGVGVTTSDYLLLQGNTATGNAGASPFQESGFSIFEPRAISDSSPGFHIVLRANVSVDNLTTFACSSPGCHTNGNGFILDDFDNTEVPGDAGIPYPYETLVEDNLSVHNGGRGIDVYASHHVTVRNNTAFWNDTDDDSVTTWRGELSAHSSSDCVFIDNIAVANPTSNGSNTAIADVSSGSPPNTGNVWTYNLTYDGTPGDSSIHEQGSDAVISAAGGNLLGVDPKLVSPTIDPSTWSFHLAAGSSAIGAGSSSGYAETDFDGVVRGCGIPTDLGAYAYP